MSLEWNGVSVCGFVRVCVSRGGAEQVGCGRSLNEWGKVGVEIVCFCFFFITSVDSGKDCVLGVRTVA